MLGQRFQLILLGLSPGDVTIGVAPLADVGMVTVGVANLADAGMAFPANPAGVVTVGVTSPADAGLVTIGVTDLADAGVVSLAAPVDIADGPECGGGVIIWGDWVSPGVWCRETAWIQSDVDCLHVNYVSCDLSAGGGGVMPLSDNSGFHCRSTLT